jgi:thymidylate synthase
MAEFDKIYKSLLKDLISRGVRETNQRTGHETTALPGLQFSIDLQKDGFPLLAQRKIPTKLFIAEQIWFISGARKPAIFLRNYTRIWDDFTNPGDVVTVAYGYRSDGLGGVSKTNIPCPYSFTVNIIGGRLNLMNVVRSNDMILGFPHDVAGFALLQAMLAQKLNVEPGTYSHIIANAHIYDIHYDAAKEMLARPAGSPKIKLALPPNSFGRAEKQDPDLVDEINQPLISKYTPGEPIKGLKIVL